MSTKGWTRGRICTVEGCGRKHRCLGLCGLHYSQVKSKRPKPERKPLTTDRLRDLLAYNTGTGEFTWNDGVVRPGRKTRRKGNSWGYTVIGFDGRHYGAHRLAWLYVMGEFPKGDIDHINGDRADNRISNLRAASRSENMQNLKGAHKDSATGFLGVHKHRNKFSAQIMVGGVKHRLGTFDTPTLAHEAYLEAKRRLHPAGVL